MPDLRTETSTRPNSFEATHVLDNGSRLSHVYLREASLSETATQAFMKRHQVGRCFKQGKYDSQHCDMAWAWRRGSAKLTELECPNCGAALSQTTTAYHRPFYVIDPAAVRTIATQRVWSKLDAALREKEAYREAQDRAETPPERMRASFIIGRCDERIDELQKRYNKLKPKRRES